MIRINI